MFKSKKFLAALSGALFVFLNETLGLGISEAAVIEIVGLLAAYVVGQAIADAGKERIKEIAKLDTVIDPDDEM